MLKRMFPSLALLVLTACSSGGSSDDKSTFEFDNAETATRVFNSSTMTCQGDCSPSAGGMTTYRESYSGSYYVGVCSLTYIGSNRVIANKHCLPDDMGKAKGKSCTKRIKIKFPKVNNFPAESFDCDRVVDYSKGDAHSEDRSANRPDWLVLSFKGSTSRPAAEINTSTGLVHGASIKTYSVFYSLNSYTDVITVTGVMKVTDCKLNRTSSFGRYFFSEFSSMFSAAECTNKVIKGNSGSGIFDASNKLVGIVSFGAKEKYLSDSDKMGGTNIACVEALGVNHPHCQFEENEDFLSELAEVASIVRYSSLPELIKWESLSASESNLKTILEKNIYKKDSENHMKISDFITTKSNGLLLNEDILRHKHSHLADFLMSDKIQCIDKNKVAGLKYIHLPIKKLAMTRYNPESEVLPVVAVPARFGITEYGENLILSLTDDDVLSSQNSDFKAYLSALNKCLVEKKNKMSFFDTACDELELKEKNINATSLETAAVVNTLEILEDYEASKIEFTVPFCM
ncbi:MAG: trypsin-like peptidase domain-containing protein [Bdellovibrionaceae bacterium]|nr:trypsin-like peptidase domain-containing protein [Pseudobdellovibrionaceae bacterium]